MLNVGRQTGKSRRRTSYWITWVTLWALLLQILAPAIAQARTPTPLAVQVCSVHGFKTVYLGADGKFSPTPKQESKKDCRCCLVGAVAPPLAFDFPAPPAAVPAAAEVRLVAAPVPPPDAGFLWQARLKQSPPRIS